MKKELIVFGASGDLGTAVSKVLIEKDYDKYYFFGRNFKIKTGHENALYIDTSDLENEENVKKAFKYIEPDKNSIIYLFSTVGGYTKSENIQNTVLDDLNSMLNKNFITSFLIAKYFVNLVRQSKSGSICFMTSFTSMVPVAGNFAYGASKNALNYLVKSLAKEGMQSNFSANAIAPNTLDTIKNREWTNDESKMVPLADIAELVNEIFQKYKAINGNIFEMPGSIMD